MYYILNQNAITVFEFDKKNIDDLDNEMLYIAGGKVIFSENDVYRVGNNVEANRASIEQVLKSIISLDNKPTLYDLFSLHQLARGTLVPEKEMAWTVFDIEDGIKSIGPRDINVINSEYLIWKELKKNNA